jgi:hypothetical protein
MKRTTILNVNKIFLEQLTDTQLVKIFPAHMEAEDTSQYSQKSDSGQYPEPVQSISQVHIQFF